MPRELSQTIAYARMQTLPTDSANCRSTICNNPWTALGSHIKGPNNMIYREWAWKVWPWAQVSGLVVVPTGNTAWAGLAGLTKPSISKSSKTQASLPPLALFPSPFISVFHSPFCVHVLILLFFLGTGPSSHPILRVVGGCWKSTRAWFWVWACQMQNSVLLCWRLFLLPFPCTEFASFPGCFGRCRA